MNPMEWLSAKAPGFDKLSPQEVEAVLHFALLWSFFEAKVLNTSASAAAIFNAVQGWAQRGRLNANAFSESLTYFKDRYFKNGHATDHLHGLNLRNNDNRPLVESVLKGENNDPIGCVSALLIVAYRLRNNLFHGVKWAYGISDQLDNFTHANDALITALETNGF